MSDSSKPSRRSQPFRPASLAGEARRTFLKQMSALGAGGVAGPLISGLGAASPLALGLGAMSEAAAQSATDYKALVCIFLYGGNDPYNTIVPYDAAGYRKYAAARTDIALPRNSLEATALRVQGGADGDAQFALAPGLAPLKPLFDKGQLAVQLNVGPLMVPTTKAQYISGSVPLPPKLFSHNDQQAYWQALAPEGASTGWGGRLADLFASGKGKSTFANVTAGEGAVLLSGRHVAGYRVGIDGSTPIELLRRDTYGSSTCTALLRELITQSQQHVLGDLHAQTVARSIEADATLRAALEPITVQGDFATPFAKQLKVVARMIAARRSLDVNRQVFVVTLNGFDNHDGLMGAHKDLLTQLGSAMAAFQQAIDAMGMGKQVTTFTASEFGRTLTSNGNGSDHGWGGHHLVMGGAVRGGRLYGSHPDIDVAGPGFVDHGRMLPSTSVETFAATLGGWFGASAGDLDDIFPALREFGARKAGFV